MKILLTSHGDFCKGLLMSYKMIAGETEDIITLDLDDDGIGKYTKRLNGLLESLLPNNEVIIMCDLKGGTPFNESFKFYLNQSKHVRLISGMNLPMLIEVGLMMNSGSSLDELVDIALTAGRTGVEAESAEATAAEDEDLF